MPAMSDPITPFAGEPEIPNKLYFRIGEVARLAGIKPYVLRFWETEFSGLGPKKSGTGHRLYKRKDVEMVLQIKRLLYEKRYTIEGARKFLQSRPSAGVLESMAKAAAASGEFPPAALVRAIKQELTDILQLLK
jgi:DNA-binding transcriptional MerR regulator